MVRDKPLPFLATRSDIGMFTCQIWFNKQLKRAEYTQPAQPAPEQKRVSWCSWKGSIRYRAQCPLATHIARQRDIAGNS